jgi:tyrosyl-tRNA synthetase
MQFLDELKWRGLYHAEAEGTFDFLHNNKAIGYVGFDPTAPSLGIGNMVPVMLLVHFQRHGHTPIALVGGATGRVGDPSGKSKERDLLSVEQIEYNVSKIQEQLRRFLDFDNPVNPAKMVNNYDWFKDFSFLDFLRDVGKHLTVNYMMAKDSVQNRIDSESGISFTEFAYQLIQGYDFVHLYEQHGCKVQFGGSDQWGNITAGTTLIRKMLGHQETAYAFTAPLITKADGTKFGKSEQGNIFVDAAMTSPFKFYQFWVNATDTDIRTLTKIFSLRPIAELQALMDDAGLPTKHLQYLLAEEMTVRVHGQAAFDRAKAASEMLYGKGGGDVLRTLQQDEVEDIFSGVPSGTVSRAELEAGMPIVDFLAASGAFPSKGAARRALTIDKSIKLNLEKVQDEAIQVGTDHIINGFFVLIDKSKQHKHLVYIA